MIKKPDWSWQDNPIDLIVDKFKSDPSSSNLVVIPTGGGKTLTTIRAVNRLINQNLLNKKDRILWITHLNTLTKNTEKSLNQNWEDYKFKNSLDKKNKHLPDILKVHMKKEGERYLEKYKEIIKIIIIDEAHHSSEDSYSKFFQFSQFIIGLTATPHRRDKKNLKYNNILYQISAIELFSKNVLVKPRMWEPLISNIKIKSNNLSSNSNKELFNIRIRNEMIANHIMSQSEVLNRIILYVGTVVHVKDLYKMLKIKNKFHQKYDYIGYVIGGHKNPSKEDYGEKLENFDYLEKNKEYNKYIIVNCGVLTEGYDDPRIDTVVMGVPTSSIVYFMQCVGRSLRWNKDNDKANIISVDDKLPNIKYRINNDWLFQDLDDELEPIVKKIVYHNVDDLKQKLNHIRKEYSIKDFNVLEISLDNFDKIDQTNLFLYNYSIKRSNRLNNKSWSYIYLTEENKGDFLTVYNTFSTNISDYLKNKENLNTRFKIINANKKIKDLDKNNDIIDFTETIEKASEEINNDKRNERIVYYSFSYEESVPKSLQLFLKDCFNSEHILDQFNDIKDQYKYIIKLPSLLSNNYEAIYANDNKYGFAEDLIDNLNDIKSRCDIEEQFSQMKALFFNLENMPMPMRFLDAFKIIIRNEIKFNKIIYEINNKKES